MAKSDFMIREYCGIEFQQERKTGMINITPLFENAPQLLESMGKKATTVMTVVAKLSNISDLRYYMDREETKELLERLAEVKDLLPKEIKRVSRSKDATGTFVHPVIFVDAMSYISVDFKIWANSLVMDALIKYRNLTAQSNKEIAKAFDEAGLIDNPAYQYGTLNIAIGDACQVAFEVTKKNSKRFLWEFASEDQARLSICYFTDRKKLNSISHFQVGGIPPTWKCLILLRINISWEISFTH